VGSLTPFSLSPSWIRSRLAICCLSGAGGFGKQLRLTHFFCKNNASFHEERLITERARSQGVCFNSQQLVSSTRRLITLYLPVEIPLCAVLYCADRRVVLKCNLIAPVCFTVNRFKQFRQTQNFEVAQSLQGFHQASKRTNKKVLPPSTGYCLARLNKALRAR